MVDTKSLDYYDLQLNGKAIEQLLLALALHTDPGYHNAKISYQIIACSPVKLVPSKLGDSCLRTLLTHEELLELFVGHYSPMSAIKRTYYWNTIVRQGNL